MKYFFFQLCQESVGGRRERRRVPSNLHMGRIHRFVDTTGSVVPGFAALIKSSGFPFRLSGRVFPRCDGHKGSLVGRGDAQPAGHLGEGLGAARPQGLLEEPSHFHADRSEDGREGLHEDRGAVPDQDQTAEEIFPPEQQVGFGPDSPSVFLSFSSVSTVQQESAYLL